MTGLEAINAHNGWAMAAVGATIVFCGLVILSFAISQIGRIVSYFEKQQPSDAPEEPVFPTPSAPPVTFAVPEKYLDDPAEAAVYYQPLANQLGDTFPLTELYQLCEANKFPGVHLSIRRLREAGILAAEGNGFFRWSQP